eukprot:2083368-Alexandrium_andersonii.AAC.1
MFGGDLNSSQYRDFRAALKKQYRWQPWETKDFDQRGVRVLQADPDAEIKLAQETYTKNIKPIRIAANRRATQEAPINESERSQLGALLGSIQWRGTQTAP